MLVFANASPVHFGTVFEDKAEAPDTSTVMFEDPSNVNVDIPEPFEAELARSDEVMPIN